MSQIGTGCYETWDLTPIPEPVRSTMYAVRPVGLETPLVESLTSYITRLAEAHCIFPGVLVSKMIAPLAPGYSPSAKHHTLFEESGKRSTLLNGVGLSALYAVQALESLTVRTDLRYLTCLPLTAILPTRGRDLFRSKKAWCATCYEQWHEEGQELYDPLLWTFQEITSCISHRQRLSTHCPYQDCGRSLPGVGWRARVGYCSYCQRWLGISSQQMHHDVPIRDEKEWLWQQWMTQAVGEVLAFLPTNPMSLERDRVQQVVKQTLHHLTAGNFTAYAHALGLQIATVHKWHQGKSTPELSMLLQFCARLGLSLREVLFQEVEMLQPCLNTLPFLEPLAPKEQVVADEEAVYEAVENFLSNDRQPPPSLKEVKQQLKHARLTLWTIHPEGCRMIVDRYQAYVQQQKEARLQRRQEEVKNVAFQLLHEGIFPTPQRVALHLPQSGILRDPQLRHLLHEICREPERFFSEKAQSVV